jgi:hypothetical protein
MGRVLVTQADQTVDLLVSYLERTRTPTAASWSPPARTAWNRALVVPRCLVYLGGRSSTWGGRDERSMCARKQPSTVDSLLPIMWVDGIRPW